MKRSGIEICICWSEEDRGNPRGNFPCGDCPGVYVCHRDLIVTLTTSRQYCTDGFKRVCSRMGVRKVFASRMTRWTKFQSGIGLHRVVFPSTAYSWKQWKRRCVSLKNQHRYIILYAYIVVHSNEVYTNVTIPGYIFQLPLLDFWKIVIRNILWHVPAKLSGRVCQVDILSTYPLSTIKDTQIIERI